MGGFGIFIDETTQLDLAGQKIVVSLLDKEGVAGRRIPAGARFVLAASGERTMSTEEALGMIGLAKEMLRDQEKTQRQFNDLRHIVKAGLDSALKGMHTQVAKLLATIEEEPVDDEE